MLQDYFTKCPEAIALKSVDSNNVQNWLTKEIIPRYGAISEWITDQGVQFISQSFQNYCKSVGIKHKTTSSFHHQTDGMVEKFNRTFLNMIRNYVSESQDEWSTHIPLILYAYRTAVNDTTGISPAEALQVRKLRLPIDVLRSPSLVFGGENENRSFDELLDKMKVIRSKIRSNAEKSLETRKWNCDRAKSHSIKSEFSINEKVYWKKLICKKGCCPKLSQIWQGLL